MKFQTMNDVSDVCLIIAMAFYADNLLYKSKTLQSFLSPSAISCIVLNKPQKSERKQWVSMSDCIVILFWKLKGDCFYCIMRTWTYKHLSTLNEHWWIMIQLSHLNVNVHQNHNHKTAQIPCNTRVQYIWIGISLNMSTNIYRKELCWSKDFS